MSKGPVDELSEREEEILRLIATGASNKEIAQQLFISANTVKVHLRNIFAKIGAASRTEAAMYAVRMGLSDSGAPAAESASETAPGAGAVEAVILPDNPAEETAVEEASGPGTAPAEAVALENLAADLPGNRTTGRAFWRRIPVWLGGLVALGALFVFGLILRPLILPEPAAATAAPENEVTGIPTPTTVVSRWTTLAPAPVLRQGMAVAAYNSVLYVVGGEADGKVVGSLDLYQDEGDTWSPLAEKPLAVTDIQAAVVGGRIIVPGGRTAEGLPSAVVEIYNPAQNTWSQAEPLPAPRSAYGLGVWEGLVYLFGGWDGKAYSATVFRYDLTANHWVELTPMPTGRGFQGVINSNGDFYVFGGWDGAHALAVNEVYRPTLEGSETPPWSGAASLPEPRYAFGSAGIAYFGYAIGGLDDNQNEPAPVQYNIQDDQWVKFSAPELGLGAHLGMAVLETNLHIFNAQAHLSYEAVKIVVIPLISP